ncbi:biotin/lipoyl-binding protein [Caulobacter segnis]
MVWLAWALLRGDKGGGDAGGGPGGPGGPGGGFGGGGRRGPAKHRGGGSRRPLRDLPIIVEALGTVKPADDGDGAPPGLPGVITQVMFREGQVVQRGQPLVQIDPRSYQMALLQAHGEPDPRPRPSWRPRCLTLTRYQTLLAPGLDHARREVDTRSATVKQLEGTVMA